MVLCAKSLVSGKGLSPGFLNVAERMVLVVFLRFNGILEKNGKTGFYYENGLLTRFPQ